MEKLKTTCTSSSGLNIHSDTSAGLNIHPDTSAGLNIQDDIFVSRNPNKLIVVKCDLVQNSTNDSVLKSCLANVRSIKSKSAALLNYIISSKADLSEFTETWLTSRDVTAKLEIVSPGYSFVHHPCSNNRTGGGIDLLYKDTINVMKIDEGEKQSFEFSEWKIGTGSFRSRFIVLYRPPYSEKHPVTMGTFLAEFAAFIESIILAPEPLIVAGNFNIHVDCGNDCNDAVRFLDILQLMGLTQHVDGPTHEDGHTLDLIITRSFDRLISTKPVVDTCVSDHASVLCDINVRKPCRSSEK